MIVKFQVICLEFTHFHTHYCCDWVEWKYMIDTVGLPTVFCWLIYTAKLIDRRGLPKEVTSTHKYKFVVFYCDNSVTAQGFRAYHYSSKSLIYCYPRTLTFSPKRRSILNRMGGKRTPTGLSRSASRYDRKTKISTAAPSRHWQVTPHARNPTNRKWQYISSCTRQRKKTPPAKPQHFCGDAF